MYDIEFKTKENKNFTTTFIVFSDFRVFVCPIKSVKAIIQAPVVQRSDNFNHLINCNPADKPCGEIST